MQDLFQQKALKHIEFLSQKLTKLGFNVSSPDKKLYNYEIIVNSNKEQAKLLVFLERRVLKMLFKQIPNQKFLMN